jgi:molybdenum cofactor cytidylyltransferase
MRMGRPKLTLPFGTGTVLEHVIAMLRMGGALPIVVVVGPNDPELASAVTAAGADLCALPAATADMRETVLHGLNLLEQRVRPAPDDAWLLAPADHVTIGFTVTRQLCQRYLSESTNPIIVPVWNGQRGHPVLIPWRHAAGIRAMPAGQGIDAYVRRFPDETIELPVADAGVLGDLDTPADYERLRRSFTNHT